VLKRPSFAAAAALLVGLLYLGTIREGHEWGDDFSMYIHHAANIAHGTPYAETGYIYNPDNPSIGPRVYPPGFPVLLAPVVKLFGLDLRAMKIVVIAFFVGSLLFIPLLFRAALPSPYLEALVLVLGLNPFLWEFKDHILSDIPFLFFLLLSLWWFTQADARSGVAAGIAAYAAYATRVLAIVLVPCFLAHDLIRHRTIARRTVVTCAVFIVLAVVQYASWIRDDSYFDRFAPTAATVLDNSVAYLRALSDPWQNGGFEAGRKIAFLAIGAAAAWGYARALRAGASALEVFPLVYLAPLLLWPSYQGTRFLIPLVPFYLYYALLGIRRIDEVVAERWGRRRVVFTTFLTLVGLTYAGQYTTLRYDRISPGVTDPEAQELFAFVRTATAPEDVFIFSKPRALALFTGRRAAAPLPSADPCRLWRYIAEIHASYAITGPDALNPDVVAFGSFVSQFPVAFRQTLGNAELAVYRVIPDSTPRSCRA
jgi:hypothetical protein